MLHKGFEDMRWTTLPVWIAWHYLDWKTVSEIWCVSWDLFVPWDDEFFHHSQIVRPLYLSFSICSSSQWLLELVWYLLRHENGTYFLFCSVWVLSGRFPGYSVATLLSSQNWTRTIGQDIVAGDNKTQPSNAIWLSVKQQVFLTVWVGLEADSLAVELLDWHSFQSFWLLGHPL